MSDYQNKRLTLEDLPKVFGQLLTKVERIEQLLEQNLKAQSSTNDQEQLLTIKEAAELLSLSVSTIYGLVSKSEIPYMKRAKRVYFNKRELLEWLESSRNKTNEEIDVEAKNYMDKSDSNHLSKR